MWQAVEPKYVLNSLHVLAAMPMRAWHIKKVLDKKYEGTDVGHMNAGRYA